MTNPKDSKTLKDFERHQVGVFLIPLLQRRESIEETLNLFDASNENIGILSRATHLFKAKLEDFEPLRQVLLKNQEFIHVEVMHQSSDLGISYQILARHKSGKELYYDGVLYRLTEIIHASEFGLWEIEKLGGYKGSFDPVVLEFEKSLCEIIPSLHVYSHTSYPFYTASLTKWDDIGFRVKGDPHLRLICRDMNYLTITALIFSERGKDYDVYLGERTSTLQMIAHETFDSMEIRDFIELAEQQRKILHVVKSDTILEMAGATSPFYKLTLKHKNWNSIKSSWKTLREVRKLLALFNLLIQAYDKVIENRWAYFNGPRQIWFSGEEQDNQEQIQHPCVNFFIAKLEDAAITDLSEKPSEPMFTSKHKELRNLVKIIGEELAPTMDDENTLLTVFQTEFSLYAVWLALLALIISLFSIGISLFLTSL